MTKKDKMQLIVLGGIILIVLGAVIYNFRESFIPKPVGSSEDYAAPDRVEATLKIDQSVFKRPDYVQLDYFSPYEITLDDIEAEPSVPVGTGGADGTTDDAEAGSAEPDDDPNVRTSF
jgi:hypothetical protein